MVLFFKINDTCISHQGIFAVVCISFKGDGHMPRTHDAGHTRAGERFTQLGTEVRRTDQSRSLQRTLSTAQGGLSPYAAEA